MAVFGENTIRVFFATIQQVQLVDWGSTWATKDDVLRGHKNRQERKLRKAPCQMGKQEAGPKGTGMYGVWSGGRAEGWSIFEWWPGRWVELTIFATRPQTGDSSIRYQLDHQPLTKKRVSGGPLTAETAAETANAIRSHDACWGPASWMLKSQESDLRLEPDTSRLNSWTWKTPVLATFAGLREGWLLACQGNDWWLTSWGAGEFINLY